MSTHDVIVLMLPIFLLLVVFIVVVMRSVIPIKAKEKNDERQARQTQAYQSCKKQLDTAKDPSGLWLNLANAAFALAFDEPDISRRIDLIAEGNQAFINEISQFSPPYNPSFLLSWGAALVFALRPCPQEVQATYFLQIEEYLQKAIQEPNLSERLQLAEGWLEVLGYSGKHFAEPYRNRLCALGVELYNSIHKDIPTARLHKKMTIANNCLRTLMHEQ